MYSATNLWKVAFFIDQSQKVTGFHSQNVQDALIVTEFDAIPNNVLLQVLLLLQLEDVAHEELLQLLVGEVYAQLLEAVGQQGYILTAVTKCKTVLCST